MSADQKFVADQESVFPAANISDFGHVGEPCELYPCSGPCHRTGARHAGRRDALQPLAGLPGIIALHALIVLSITIVLSVLNVYYKDVEIILSVVLRGWMYLSPIIYPLHIIPDQYIDWYLLNPMAVVISLYRWTFFADTVIPLKYIVYVWVWPSSGVSPPGRCSTD